ncbi:MAG: hypothetical protein KAT68_13380 [Bacteroidales bacterium]|nr:hypothetical protein [Bacteroidales bacterium]
MKKIFILIITMFLLFNGFSQHQNIKISNKNYPNEPSIAMNPLNTNELVAGYNIYNCCYSTDGGLTWEHTILSSTYGVWGDPCIIADNNGDFYFFHLSNPSEGSWIDRIVCQKTSDVGQTWNNGSFTGLNGYKAQDKEWAVVDRSNNNIYVTWTQFDQYGSSDTSKYTNIMFSKSVDNGETWTNAIRINEISGDCIDDDNTVEGAVPTIGTNGEIYVSWAGPEGIVFDKSLDYGETWLDNDIFVSDIPGGWAINIPGIFRCNGMPVTCCDTSGGVFNGTIYINWSDQRNGTNNTDIWLSKSTDNGNTWSEPLKINNDNSGKHQFFTWMTIDQVTGYLYFVFYDRRNYDDSKTDVYMAVSKDGGETFINFKISESPFIPDPNVFFGDYNNIVAHNNVICPVWTRFGTTYDYDMGLSIWTAIIDINAVGIDNEIAIPFSVEQNYPNPFTASTYFSFKLYETTEISLKVFDIYAREVATVINNKILPPGKYVESFYAKNNNISSGVYYFLFSTPQKTITKKMIYIK